jgi:hypothetical protein
MQFSNLYLVSFLLTQGFPIEQIERDYGRVYFCFYPSKVLQEQVKTYTNGLVLVNVGEFQSALARVKDLIRASGEEVV